METYGASPQRPSSVRSPDASKPIACCQPSSATIMRGQGRCCSATLIWVMRSSRAMVLSQQPRDILEAGDKRRWHVDTHHSHDGEMREHRHVGSFRRRGRPARFAEDNGVKPQEQAAQAHQNSEYQDDREPWLAREG